MPSWLPFVGTMLFSLVSALLGAAITITRIGGKLDLFEYRMKQLENFKEEARPPIHWARNRMLDDNFMPSQIVRLVECIDTLSAHVKKLDDKDK